MEYVHLFLSIVGMHVILKLWTMKVPIWVVLPILIACIFNISMFLIRKVVLQ